MNRLELLKQVKDTINTSNSLASINKQVYFILQSLPKQVTEHTRNIKRPNKEKQNG